MTGYDLLLCRRFGPGPFAFPGSVPFACVTCNSSMCVQAILGDLDIVGGGGDGGLSGAAIGGIIAAAVALLLLFIAGLVLCVRRRKAQRERADATKDLDLGLMDHDSDSLDGNPKARAPAVHILLKSLLM